MFSRTGAGLDDPPFSAEQCRVLYANVEQNDEVDAQVTLPDAIHLDYTQDQFLQAFRICRQVWKQGIDRRAFQRLIDTVAHDGEIRPDDALAFKHMRAKFKHLRFAYATFGARHRYPRVFDWATQTMGLLQDGFKNGKRRAVVRNAILLRLFLSAGPYALLSREIDAFRPSTVAGLRAYLGAQIGLIRTALAQPEVTGKQFHDLRKIISRQVSFYDSLKTLYPSDYHNRISRYLSAINGLMGGMHDDLVVLKLADEAAYLHRTFALPPEIRARLTALVERYPV